MTWRCALTPGCPGAGAQVALDPFDDDGMVVVATEESLALLGDSTVAASPTRPRPQPQQQHGTPAAAGQPEDFDRLLHEKQVCFPPAFALPAFALPAFAKP